MKTLILTTFLLLSFSTSAEVKQIKNGRQFTQDLTFSLGLNNPNFETFVNQRFEELKSNFPKQGYLSEFEPSFEAYAKMTDTLCSLSSTSINRLGKNSAKSTSELVSLLHLKLIKKDISKSKLENIESLMSTLPQSTTLEEKYYQICFAIALSRDFIFLPRFRE